MVRYYTNLGVEENTPYDGQLVGNPSFMGLGTDLWGQKSTGTKSDPVKFNDNHQKSKGWSLVGKDYQKLSKKDRTTFSKYVYVFQHAMEVYLKTPGCSGSINPDVKDADCYNRDGMIGTRTLQFLGYIQWLINNNKTSTLSKISDAVGGLNYTVEGETDTLSNALSGAPDLTIPSSYVKDYTEFGPASDVAVHIANGEGTAGQVHKDLISGGGSSANGSGKPPKPPKESSVSFWDKKVFGMKYKYAIPGAIGLLGVAGFAAYSLSGVEMEPDGIGSSSLRRFRR